MQIRAKEKFLLEKGLVLNSSFRRNKQHQDRMRNARVVLAVKEG